MGGKNHQPCRTYLPNSTRLSRHLSLAYAHLEFGNAVLEDILLSELNTTHTSATALTLYSQLDDRFKGSVEELGMAGQASADLRKQMAKAGFVDLPTIDKIDLTAIGADLAERGMINLASWQHIQKCMVSGGFYEVLDNFDAKINELIKLTRSLQSKFESLRPAITEGSLTDIVEGNLPGSFKPEFATVYTAWTEFNALFLASSLMSTELWYAFTGKSSLAPNMVRLHIA